MEQKPVELFTMPENLLFSLKDISYIPEAPRLKESFTIKGKINLFGIPFFLPIWIMATVTYPETWWEKIIPIIGAKQVREVVMAIGSDFEITFSAGFLYEGEFDLVITTYLGPTAALDSIVLPPSPSMATYKAKFNVAGAAPPVTETFTDFRILGYSKGAGTIVTPNNTLELNTGDTCRVHIGFNHKGTALNMEFYTALWVYSLLDPHNEIISAHKLFNIPASTDWQPYQNYIDLLITSVAQPGDYGLYAKDYSATPQLISPYLPQGVIKIVSVEGWKPAKTELARATFSVLVVQSGWFPANTKLASQPFSVTIVQSDWKAANVELARKAFSVSIVQSDWKPAKTELARATFSVVIVAVEYFTLTLVAYPDIFAGWITTEPSVDKFPAGSTVWLTAHPIWPYKFSYWLVDDEWFGSSNPTKIIAYYDHTVTAVFVT